MNRYYFPLWMTALVTLLVSCNNTGERVIARVGKATLTVGDLNKNMPHHYRADISREQHSRYIKQWIDNQLLYQEALRKNIHKEKEIRQRLDNIKRDLLCAEVISRSTGGYDAYRLPESAVTGYFEKNRESFKRDSDVVKYIEIVVDDIKTAWSVRNMVTRDNFLTLARRYSKTPVPDPADVHFMNASEIPREIAEVVFNIRINGTTSPIKTSDGYHVVRVLDKQPPGTNASLDEVRSEIVNILSTRAHKKRLEELLSELRLKTDIEVNPHYIPDSGRGHN